MTCPNGKWTQRICFDEETFKPNLGDINLYLLYMALCFRGFFANTPQSQNLSSKMFKVFALDASAIWWRCVVACSMHVLSSISMYFYTVSLSCYMHIRSSSWHLSDHGWADVTSMDLAVCQCLPIGTCRILLHHSRRPFLNSPPYAALIHFMQFMHLYNEYSPQILYPHRLILYSVHLCPFGFGVYRKFRIWTSAPRPMGWRDFQCRSRFLQDMSVNLTSSIMLGRCRLH